MHTLRLWLSILLLSLSAFAGTAQTVDAPQPEPVDSVRLSHIDPVEMNEEFEDNDFNPGLFLILVFGLLVACAGVGIGIVLAVVCFFLMAGLIAAGILSASVMVGVYNRSFAKGFQTFWISSAAVAGLFVGGIFMLLLYYLFDPSVHVALVVGSGALFGLVGGVALGFISSTILRKLASRFMKKFERKFEPQRHISTQ